MTMTAENPRAAGLSRAISSAQYFTVAFGCVVGVAWVIVLGDVVTRAGPVGAALAMALGALAMLFVAVCYAEVAAARPAAGGELVYAYELAGPGASFATGWLLALIYVSGCAFEAISIGAVSELLFPGASGPVLYRLLGQDVRLGAIMIGFGGALALGGLNLAGAGMSAKAQQWATYARIVLMFVFLGVALVFGRPENLQPLFAHAPGATPIGAVFAVAATAPFWFGGFTVFATATEESSSYMRDVGRAIVLAVIGAAVFYVAMILAIGALAPRAALAGMKLPAAQAFEFGAHSPAMAKVVLTTALLGNLTAWNALLLAGSRVLFALGRGRLGPGWLGAVHPRSHAPAAAIAFISVISIAALLLGRGFISPIVNVASICYGAMYVVTCVTLIKLRKTEPGRVRAFSAPGGIATAAVAIVASLGMIYEALVQPGLATRGGLPTEWLVLGGWIVAGAILWVAATKARARVPEGERASLLRGGLATPPAQRKA